jgi:myo-inositol-1(or 4)-monophosphatase
MERKFSLTELEAVCKKAIEVTKGAGAFLKKEAQNFDLSKIEYKGSKDLVSYVDKQSEQLLVKGLKEILPEAGFITEEATVEQSSGTALQWIIDPLDGTTNFLHGQPSYSISVALMLNKEIIVGIVYEPNLDECYYAWKEGGAFCNGKKIKVSSISQLDKSLIATGFPYSLLGKEDTYFKIMREFVDTTHGLRRIGSAAVDLAYVACGRFEGYYEFNLKIWDIAAGILLVKEAGGKVTDYSGGNDYLYGKELLAAGGLHPEMLRVIQNHWK